jgi:hypothetical protein
MITRKSVLSTLSSLFAMALAIPFSAGAQSNQQAGKFSAVIPLVNVHRGAQQLSAANRMPVLWGDAVNTGKLARARVTLDDGSVLNVGSESILNVVKHDAGAQQTELELTYGRVRASAVKLTKPGASFKVRTPTGVAGVVGTDFFLAFEDFITRLVVFAGSVQFCNLGGVCVTVGAAQMSVIRGNNPPDQPVTTPPADVSDVTTSTAPSGTGGGAAGAAGAGAGGIAAHGVLLATTLAIATVVPAALVRGLSTTPVCHCQKIVTAPPTGAASPAPPQLRHRP